MSMKKVAAAISTITKSPRKQENSVVIRGGQNVTGTPLINSPNVPNEWSSVPAENGESSKEQVQGSQSTQSFITTVSPTNSVTSVDSSTSEPSPCGRCRKLVKRGDCALQCEICRQWFHIKCEEVTKQEYKMMQESNQPKQAKKHIKLHWFCATCNCQTVDFMTGLSIQQGRLDNIERRVEGIENDIKTNNENVESLKERVNKIENNQGNLTKCDGDEGELHKILRKKLKEHSDEEREQNRRKNNIVVFNLPESDGGTPQDRMNRDLEAFNKLTKEGCKMEVKKNEIEKCYRLGKVENNKTRPLLIKLKDEEKKKKLFLSLQTLREHKGKYENVKIGHDMTKTQREEHKAKIEEAKKMDEEEGSENYIHLVRGPPENLRIVKVPRKPRTQ